MISRKQYNTRTILKSMKKQVRAHVYHIGLCVQLQSSQTCKTKKGKKIYETKFIQLPCVCLQKSEMYNYNYN